MKNGLLTNSYYPLKIVFPSIFVIYTEKVKKEIVWCKKEVQSRCNCIFSHQKVLYRLIEGFNTNQVGGPPLAINCDAQEPR